MTTFPRAASLLKSCFILATVLTTSSLTNRCFAELLTVTAEGEYVLGDHDTKEDGTRLAIEAAKRHALEQVVTYVESVTTATALDLTRDEIRTYTAGVVLVSEQHVSTRLDGDQIIMHADLTAQIDPEEAALAVITLRQNDDARRQLQLLKTEVDDLHQQLEQTTARLAAATSPEQVLNASQQRQDMLNRVQSDQVLTQAWTDWALTSPTAYPSPWIGVGQVYGLWAHASFLYPANPHLVVLQRVLPGPVPSHLVPTMTSIPMTAMPQRQASHSIASPRPSATSMAAPSAPLRRLQPTHRLPPTLRLLPNGAPSGIHRPPFRTPSRGAGRSSGGGGSPRGGGRR